MANQTRKVPPIAQGDSRRAEHAEDETQLLRPAVDLLTRLATVEREDVTAFLTELSSSVGELCAADLVLVGRLARGGTLLPRPTVWLDKHIVESADFELATPLRTGASDELATLAETVVRGLAAVGEWSFGQASACVGAPLRNAKGEIDGILLAACRTPQQSLANVAALLPLFATQATLALERVSHAEALLQNDARFDAFCQATPLGIFETDDEGYCTYVSAQWQAFTGRRADELLGNGWRQILHPDDVPIARETWRQASVNRKPYVNEFRILLPNGDIRWARAVARRVACGAGQAGKYFGCVEDVTDRRQAEQAQRASEERFRAFMDNSPAIAFMKDGAGRRVYANLPYVERFQIGDEEVLGKTDLDMFGAKLARKLAANDERVLREGVPVQTIEEVPTADGVLRHWLVYKFPVDAGGGERYIGGVAVDITERRHAEEQLRQTRDELEKRVASRTSSLTVANTRLQQEILERESAEAALRTEQVLLRRLLFRQEADRKLIAYEIHDGPVQYVTAALMHLETAFSTAPPESPEGQAAFNTAVALLRDTIHEARRMISGLQPMVLDQAGLVPAIECLIDEHFDRSAVTFEHHLRDERLTPLLEGALFRICQEALTNATKHSKSPTIHVQLRQDHAWVRLEVVDQGVGFDPDLPVQAHSFGLRGIRERARLLGGHAMIDSAAGHGTRVAVELPVTAD